MISNCIFPGLIVRFRGSVTAIYGYCRLLQNAPKEEEGYLSLETAFCQQHAQGEELGGMAFVLHIDWICAPQLSSDQYDTEGACMEAGWYEI